MVSHNTLVFAREGSEAKTAPSLMPVPQVHVPMVHVVPIGITTTTAPAHLASRERTAAMTLMSAASLACASMVVSASILMGPSAASANLVTAGVHVRCPPSPVPHLSALMGAPADRLATVPTSVLAYQAFRDTTVRIMWMTVQAISV